MIHQGKKPIGVVDSPCAGFVEPFKIALAEAGLAAVQSFDLQSTRALHEGCTCPHHGTSQCTCELVVLLVYGQTGDPLSLVLDGRDGQTELFAADSPGSGVDAGLYAILERVIQKTAATQGFRP